MSERSVRIDYSKTFLKQLKKAPFEIKVAFRKRLAFFLQDRRLSQLHDHALTGEYLGYRSINVSGDWRAIYSEQTGENDERIIIFKLIRTHSQLYG